MLRDLCAEHDFTVFSVEFNNPCPDRIRWVRVPAPASPLALLFVLYHVLAPILYFAYRLRHKVRFDLVQIVESNLTFGDVSYSHFCHKAYLKQHWKQTRPTGIRRCLRFLDHWLHAAVEAWIYRRVKKVIAPSEGIAQELRREYHVPPDKVRIVGNPIDVSAMVPPPSFDREGLRHSLGFARTDMVVAFVALGHFERKGLQHLLIAFGRLRGSPLKLLVVGGEPQVVRAWQSRASKSGLGAMVKFVGFAEDVRPYLWAADAAVLPSSYEVFPLAAIQSLAAGLPLLATSVNGVKEFLRDGVNGILINGFCPEAVEGALVRLVALSSAQRHQFRVEAERSSLEYDAANFLTAWRRFYADFKMEPFSGKNFSAQPLRPDTLEHFL